MHCKRDKRISRENWAYGASFFKVSEHLTETIRKSALPFGLSRVHIYCSLNFSDPQAWWEPLRQSCYYFIIEWQIEKPYLDIGSHGVDLKSPPCLNHIALPRWDFWWSVSYPFGDFHHFFLYFSTFGQIRFPSIARKLTETWFRTVVLNLPKTVTL